MMLSTPAGPDAWPCQDFHFVPFLGAEQRFCYRCVAVDNTVDDNALRLADGELKCFAITGEIAHPHSITDRYGRVVRRPAALSRSFCDRHLTTVSVQA
jgi:hypothetical protein